MADLLPPTFEGSTRGVLDAEGWCRVTHTICARHGLIGEASMASSGTAPVWAVGDEILIKLDPPKWAHEIDAEVAWMRRLAGRLPVAVPEALDRGEIDGWPYVIMRRVPGRALDEVWPRLDREARLALMGELGPLMATLHAVPPEPGDPQMPGGWSAFLAARRAEALEAGAGRHGRGAYGHLADQIPALIARVEADGLLDTAEGPRAPLHTELLGAHLFVGEDQGRFRLSGLIDLAEAGVGHPAYEISAPVQFITRGEPGLLQALMQAYGHPLDEGARLRLAVWHLHHQYSTLSAMLAPLDDPGLTDLTAACLALYTP